MQSILENIFTAVLYILISHNLEQQKNQGSHYKSDR
ncbi:hypothetical protein PSMA108079_16510 [Pseudoalteromonas mariniglutinosa]